ncbi:MAG: hypothetical protein K2X29_12580 [Candidatus Obscuribacterales bacterium]|nr:hypothetical protein [Candidatus Obscuribacterales bacterium]
MEAMLPSFLTIGNYQQSLSLIDELTGMGEDDDDVNFFFNRGRNQIHPFEIRHFMRLQTGRNITTRSSVALHNLIFMNCPLSAGSTVSATRDVMSDLERWKEQSILWWGMVREFNATPGVQVLILGTDDCGSRFELVKGDYERLASIAFSTLKKYSAC